MKLQQVMASTGWTEKDIAMQLGLPITEVQKWDEIPNEYTAVFMFFVWDASDTEIEK